jgi:hypothetical protein
LLTSAIAYLALLRNGTTTRSGARNWIFPFCCAQNVSRYASKSAFSAGVSSVP